jgi:hypothetical protein
MQSVPITTKVVSSNHVHGQVYSMQHYVVNFVSDLRQGDGFVLSTPVSSTNKTDRHNTKLYNRSIAESGIEHHKT